MLVMQYNSYKRAVTTATSYGIDSTEILVYNVFIRYWENVT